MLEVKIKKISNNAIIPTYATDGSTGLDLYSTIDCHLARTCIIPLDIALEIPEGHVGYILPKSGLTKIGIVAEIGTIDSDYRGNINVILFSKHYERDGLLS
jgi:dUTP pyrophosphatase